MRTTDYEFNYFKSRWWRIIGFLKAVRFAWKHPRHVQVALVKDPEEEGWQMVSNWSGVNEKGFLRVIQFLGREAKGMEDTGEGLKDILDDGPEDP